MNPLVELIAGQPGMAERLLSEHTNDGTGHFRVSRNGAQRGNQKWPCSIHGRASEATKLSAR